MRKYIYLIILSSFLVSCYTYQIKKSVDTPTEKAEDIEKNKALGIIPPAPAENVKSTSRSKKVIVQQAAPAPLTIQEKLAPNKNVRIDVDGKSYKVIVDRWEKDSLVAHPIRNANKVLKFHKNQIDAERIAEKRFSQPIADIITVVAYAGIGFGIWSLLQ
ncbi:hypothetical protein [Chryseobacterium terrae]|uniref:Lipoprotein n=1 Tax=Chryseobacterium terrae TaxID=3163299 RepID=A0ABW8Y363_9FLAO